MPIRTKPWVKKKMPKRVLVIRLQAMGDMVITLPYLQDLRNKLSHDVKIDLFTRKEVDSIPRSLNLFNKVYSIGGKRNFKKQFIYACLVLPVLLFKQYDVVIDLQNNMISKLIRKFLKPIAWSEFDKTSPVAAGERTRLTIESLRIQKIEQASNYTFKKDLFIEEILKVNGWNGVSNLIIINPAGAFTTRNWPLENYKTFINLWLQQFPQTQFLIIGVDFIASKTQYLKNILGDKLINLINKTTPAQAFAIIQKVKFILSEDSGLMHMAWVSNIPTLALFGSTRSNWSKPLGKNSVLLDSSDLPCGNCLLEFCKYKDVHCLTRYSPEFVFDIAKKLYTDCYNL